MLILSLLLYLACSIILQKGLFQQFSITKLIQVFFLVIFSFNIVLFGLLSLLGMANQSWISLILQALMCAITCLFIFRRNLFTFQSLWSDFHEKIRTIKIRDYFLIVFIGVVLIAFFTVGITTPPNNIDSLDPTHLARVYYAIQQGTLLIDNYHQVARPLNIHIVHFWLFLLGRSENLFFIVQWFSLIVVLVTVYRISRFLGFTLTKALISAFVILSFPVVMLQTYSSQGDLAVAALVLMSISFAVEYSIRKQTADILFAAISLIIALGTKNTAFLVLPVFGIYIVIWLFKNIRHRKVNVKFVLILAVLLIFSGFQFIVNIVNTGSFFGNGRILGYDYSSLNNFWEKAKFNLPRYTYQLIGFDGLPFQIQSYLINKKAGLFSSGLSRFGIDLESEVILQPGFSQNEVFQYNKRNDLNEDSSWFGPICLFIPLALIVSLLSTNSIRRKYSLFSLFLFLIYYFLVFLQRPGWDPYQSRYFISAILPGVPLLPILIPDRKFLKQFIPAVIILASLMVVSFSFFTNTSKPVITQKESHDFIYENFIPIPSDNDIKIIIKEKLRYIFAYLTESTPWKSSIYKVTYLEQVYYNDLTKLPDVKFINSLVPEDSPLFFWFREKNLEYGLFGKNKTRDLYPVYKQDQTINGYFVTYSSIFIEPSDKVNLLGDNGHYKVYYLSD